MSFSLKISPESQAKIDSLARIGAIDLRPVMNVIGRGYRKEVDLIFSRKQARGEGLRWPQLSEKYAIRKEMQYPGQPILVRTGRLKESMTSEGAEGNINIIAKTSAIFGTTVPYGIYHDKGGDKIPKRNFSDISQRRRDIWIKQIEDSLIHDFESAGIDVEGGI